MRYQCLLFDLDNTLIRKAPSIPEKAHEILSRRFPTLALATVEELYAKSECWIGEQTQAELETGVRMSDDEFLGRVLSVYRDRLGFDDSTARELLPVVSDAYPFVYKLANGAREALDSLSLRGVKLGIVSNHRSAIRAELDRLGIAKYFSCVVISDDAGVSKPDPAILEMARGMVGIDRRNCAYVGDHPFDVLCAHAAGMDAIWMPINARFTLPEGADAPEYTLRAFSELLTLPDTPPAYGWPGGFAQR